MMVNRDQIMYGWMKYAENDMARNRNDLIGRWGIPWVAGLMFNNAWNGIMNRFKEDLCEAGYMTPEGLVDIDRIHTEFSDISKRMGKAIQGIPMLGEYAFTDQDVDRLYQYIITS